MAGVGPKTPAAGYGMISIAEAQKLALEHTGISPVIDVSISQSVGSILAESVVAKDPLPPFPASIKDGYAVCSSDGVGEFTIVGDAWAGSAGGIEVKPGNVAYITTGAPVPSGADAVVQIEDTESLQPGPNGEKRVKIKKAASVGQDIRPVGCDIECGAVILSAGDKIGVAEVGLLATVGATTVKVYKQPKVAILSNGDEVVDASTVELTLGQIRDSNRPMMLAAAQEAGCEVLDMGIAGDEDGSLEDKFSKAMDQGADVIITSGGVSMGAKDLIKPLLERLGQVYFGKVRMKPGKPLTFATIAADTRKVLVFALPGNPVSSFACFNLVVRPSLKKLQGAAEPLLRRVHVRLASKTDLDPVRPEYARAKVHWQSEGNGGVLVAESTGSQMSSRLLSARSANVLMELPQAEGALDEGTLVSALLVDDLRSMPVTEEIPPTAKP